MSASAARTVVDRRKPESIWGKQLLPVEVEKAIFGWPRTKATRQAIYDYYMHELARCRCAKACERLVEQARLTVSVSTGMHNVFNELRRCLLPPIERRLSEMLFEEQQGRRRKLRRSQEKHALKQKVLAQAMAAWLAEQGISVDEFCGEL